MTVRDLIDKLKKMDEDCLVLMNPISTPKREVVGDVSTMYWSNDDTLYSENHPEREGKRVAVLWPIEPF